MREETEVQVFGGADVLLTRPTPSRNMTVGQSNIQTALEILKREGFNLIAFDLGGLSGRTIQFHTWNGHVLLRRLPTHN